MAAWERLSNNPLDRQPRRQYPLRGIMFHPFWELEPAASERIWYAVDEIGFITIVAARNDIHTAPKLARYSGHEGTHMTRRWPRSFELPLKTGSIPPLRIPEWAVKRARRLQ